MVGQSNDALYSYLGNTLSSCMHNLHAEVKKKKQQTNYISIWDIVLYQWKRTKMYDSHNTISSCCFNAISSMFTAKTEKKTAKEQFNKLPIVWNC